MFQEWRSWPWPYRLCWFFCSFFLPSINLVPWYFWLSNLIQKCAFNLRWRVLIYHDWCIRYITTRKQKSTKTSRLCHCFHYFNLLLYYQINCNCYTWNTIQSVNFNHGWSDEINNLNKHDCIVHSPLFIMNQTFKKVAGGNSDAMNLLGFFLAWFSCKGY